MFFIWFDDLSELGTSAFVHREWRWCRIAPGSRLEGRGDLESIRSALISEPDEVSLLLAARECIHLRLEVPPMSARSLRQALPFIAEEHVAQSVESMHFAIGQRNGEHLSCLGISKSLLHLLLEVVSEYGISPIAAYSDATLLQAREGSIGVLMDGDRILIRTARSALEAPRQDAIICINLIIEQSDESNPALQLEVLTNDGVEALDGLALPDVTMTQRRIARSPLAELVSSPINEINLLVADFEPVAPGQRERTWRLPLALAASFLILLFTSDLIIGFNALSHTQGLQEESISLVDGLQNSDEVVRLIHREQGSRSQETRDFLNLLAQFSQVSEAHGASLRTLSYQSGSGAIDIEVLVSNYDVLDDFSNEAQDAFQEADMLGATQTAEGVRARLRLVGAGQ